MIKHYLKIRLKVVRQKFFLSCFLGVCLLVFLYCYWTLLLHSHLRKFYRPSPNLQLFLWGAPEGQSLDPHSNLLPEGSDWITLPDLTGPQGELHRRSFFLRNDSTPYFVRTKSGALCFRDGIEQADGGLPQAPGNHEEGELPENGGQDKCVCRPGWHGPYCGIPTLVQHSNLATRGHLHPRQVSRRVINAININHEFDLLHARFHELASVVDLFLVCESNFTAYGEPKDTLFLRMLLNGTFDYVRHKILYVFLDHFPKGGRQNGWIADDYLRTFLTHNGLSRLRGHLPDDVFIMNDADEIPSSEGILFLKLFNGWTEPFGFHLRKSLYGFYRRQPGTLDILSGCTLAMLTAVYGGDGIMLRRRDYFNLPGFRQYEKNSGHLLVPWSLGSAVHYAGWHCSWCFRPEGIYHKLVSAQNGDFPRWGDYKEKRDMTYIRELIRTGAWFDGTVEEYPPTHPRDFMFAPEYLLRNFERYHYLLKNPYGKLEKKIL